MPKLNALPDKDELNRLFRYDPATGQLFWKKRTNDMFQVSERGRSLDHACAQWNGRFADKEALTKHNLGYRCGRLNYQYVMAHRVIWKMMTGEDAQEIDHIDGNRANNAWTNLRSVTPSLNRRNTKLRSDNTSGNTGVRLDPKTGRWRAVISMTIHLGTFASREEALAARKNAEVKYGFHPNHGRGGALSETPEKSTDRIFGVVWDTQRKLWLAHITVNGKHHFLGRFDTKDAAIEARKFAEIEHGWAQSMTDDEYQIEETSSPAS